VRRGGGVLFLLQSFGIHKHPSPIKIKASFGEEGLLDRDAPTGFYRVD
jgi:hypothetical protein